MWKERKDTPVISSLDLSSYTRQDELNPLNMEILLFRQKTTKQNLYWMIEISVHIYVFSILKRVVSEKDLQTQKRSRFP